MTNTWRRRRGTVLAAPYADARLQLWSDNSFCAQRFKFVPTS
jgi:hypothetical protein